MKIVKRILIGLTVVIAVLLLMALFVKKEYAVEREITINKPVAEVFNYIKHIRNQDNYSTWNRKDPNMKKEYRGTDGTVGFVAAWDSKNDEVGKGEQEIKNINEGERMDMELRFYKPFKATDNAYMTTEAVGENRTKVKWGFNGKMPYPMNLMLVFMNMDKMLGTEMQTGLNDLKALLEK